MAVSHHPGALLASSYALPRGPRVTLRLVRGRDLPGIRELARRAGADLDELALVRLVNFDLSARIVMCATALVGTSETVVGVGAIELNAPSPAPSGLIVDDQLTDGLAGLLTAALVGHAAALARARVA
jgi:hypothetical protein